jgi:hypothetical protein
MAVLQQPVNNSNPFADLIGDDLAPAGTFVATILDVKDEFGIQRQKYQSTELETVDLTTFLFGFRDAQGAAHRVSSRRMRISGNEKSNLFGFLKSMLGHAPKYGWDYCSLKGQQCLLTVEHVQRRDGSGVFAGIATLSPVPQGMGSANGQLAAGSGQPAGTGGQFAASSGPGASDPVQAGAPAGPAVPSVAPASVPVGATAGMPAVGPMAPNLSVPHGAGLDDSIPF